MGDVIAVNPADAAVPPHPLKALIEQAGNPHWLSLSLLGTQLPEPALQVPDSITRAQRRMTMKEAKALLCQVIAREMPVTQSLRLGPSMSKKELESLKRTVWHQFKSVVTKDIRPLPLKNKKVQNRAIERIRKRRSAVKHCIASERCKALEIFAPILGKAFDPAPWAAGLGVIITGKERTDFLARRAHRLTVYSSMATIIASLPEKDDIWLKLVSCPMMEADITAEMQGVDDDSSDSSDSETSPDQQTRGTSETSKVTRKRKHRKADRSSTEESSEEERPKSKKRSKKSKKDKKKRGKKKESSSSSSDSDSDSDSG